MLKLLSRDGGVCNPKHPPSLPNCLSLLLSGDGCLQPQTPKPHLKGNLSEKFVIKKLMSKERNSSSSDDERMRDLIRLELLNIRPDIQAFVRAELQAILGTAVAQIAELHCELVEIPSL